MEKMERGKEGYVRKERLETRGGHLARRRAKEEGGKDKRR